VFLASSRENRFARFGRRILGGLALGQGLKGSHTSISHARDHNAGAGFDLVGVPTLAIEKKAEVPLTTPSLPLARPERANAHSI